jgi:hypothetical protein
MDTLLAGSHAARTAGDILTVGAVGILVVCAVQPKRDQRSPQPAGAADTAPTSMIL